ncbi:hypothetical protein Aros01_04473 [Streptosporangium roseum]|uniref:DUF3703 domain-containing protein n=1 Tax=Streptosporangium roseum TaxID=2001 RepID=UPI00247A15EC|nr:DUF3703 domain-containing protein [Streptosporangium roseum]
MPAHIVSQPWPWPHTPNHLAMFALAVRRRDRREAIGQVVRTIVAAPGSALGRYPATGHFRLASGGQWRRPYRHLVFGDGACSAAHPGHYAECPLPDSV